MNIDDFAGRWTSGDRNAPLQSFWHWIIETEDIHNGCYIYMCEEWKEEAEDWQIQIIDWFLEEFGEDEFGRVEVGQKGLGKIGVDFWVEW